MVLNIMAGWDSQSNCTSTSKSEILSFIQNLQHPMSISTSGGITTVNKKGIVVIELNGKLYGIPNVLYLPQSGRDFIISMSTVSEVNGWKFEWPVHVILGDLEFDVLSIELYNGLYCSRVNILTANEVSNLIKNKDLSILKLINHIRNYVSLTKNITYNYDQLSLHATAIDGVNSVTPGITFDNSDWCLSTKIQKY